MIEPDACPTYGIRSAYTNKGCRCDWCRTELARSRREYRKRANPAYDRAYSLAQRRASIWVRAEHPETWREMLAQAKHEIRMSTQGGDDG